MGFGSATLRLRPHWSSCLEVGGWCSWSLDHVARWAAHAVRVACADPYCWTAGRGAAGVWTLHLAGE